MLDTNILVSAILGGKLSRILDSWIAGQFILLVSDDIITEYIKVLNRPKFGLPQQVVDDIIGYLFQKAEFVMPAQGIEIIKDDPDDNKFLAVALAGNAEVIVSGDQHLLKIGLFQHIEIINAREFLQLIEGKRWNS